MRIEPVPQQQESSPVKEKLLRTLPATTPGRLGTMKPLLELLLLWLLLLVQRWRLLRAWWLLL